MGYVAVKGGTKAIEESIKMLNYERVKNRTVLDISGIENGMGSLIDLVMSEASLYSRKLAAIGLKQSCGNIEEAVFLLRAYRSTLPRKHITKTVNTRQMKVERRISASFKDILGGQILGATYDYTHRLIDFSLADETIDDINKWLEDYKIDLEDNEEIDYELDGLPKVMDYLRAEGVLLDFDESNDEPKDITKTNLEFPTKRSERLQILTRGETGAVKALAYSALRTSGFDDHPNVGELRVGDVPLYIGGGQSEEEDYYLGEIKATEVESFIPTTIKNENGENVRKLDIGYGLCFGCNESKAISMSILDNCLNKKNNKYPTGNEEFVLLSVDTVEASGFISHLKLPHYVTFQSELDSIRKGDKGE